MNITVTVRKGEHVLRTLWYEIFHPNPIEAMRAALKKARQDLRNDGLTPCSWQRHDDHADVWVW